MERQRDLLGRALFFLAPLALTAVVTAGPSAGATARPLVRAQVPLNQRVSDLLNGRLVEKLMCAQACKTTTTIYIRARLAERLGFKGVTGRPVPVGSRTITLAARRQTTIHVSLDASPKKLLTKANAGIQLMGQVGAQTASAPSRTGAADWITFLSR